MTSATTSRVGTVRRRAVTAGLGFSLVVGGIGFGASPGPAAAAPGGGKPLNYGDCVAQAATTGGGRAAKAYAERTAPFQGVVNGDDPPGLDDQLGIKCSVFGPGNK